MTQFLFAYLAIITVLRVDLSVEITEPPALHEDNVTTQLGTMRNTIKVLSDQWERWNTLFITSLEPRIASTASTLSSIDNNVHNLQERAHIWDTFQLHVAAWNEQLATMDRKIDILNKAVEQISAIDTKMNTMLSDEFKLDKVIKMINSLLELSLNIDNNVKSKQYCKSPKDSLFEEFAARGILSSLKLVERKVDQLLNPRHCDNSRSSSNDNMSGPKYVVSKSMENLIGDIASKVDVIFDSVSKINEVEYADDYIETIRELEGSGSPLHGQKAFKRSHGVLPPFCKSVEHQIKALDKRMQGMENKVDNFSNDLIHPKDMVQLMDQLAKTVSVNQTKTLHLLLDNYLKNSANSPNHVPLVTHPPVTENSIKNSTQAVTADSARTEDISEATATMRKPASSCSDLDPNSPSGLYTFFLNSRRDFLYERFFNKQLCELRNGSLWTVIQRRDNQTVQQDFNVSWYDYKLGFGDLKKEFWIGNNFLSRFSSINNLTLRIELEDFEGNSAWAQYEDFTVAAEDDDYKLTVGKYIGNASDSLSSHSGSKFSTYDRKNDLAPECCSCSISYGGGWWFNRCFETNLNGVYHKTPTGNLFRGLIWEHWLGDYSLKKSVMMIKVKNNDRDFFRSHVGDIEEP